MLPAARQCCFTVYCRHGDSVDQPCGNDFSWIPEIMLWHCLSKSLPTAGVLKQGSSCQGSENYRDLVWNMVRRVSSPSCYWMRLL